MKGYKNILILTLLTLFHFTSIPVFADVTEYQNPNINMEESSAECEVIYKTTYDLSEDFINPIFSSSLKSQFPFAFEMLFLLQ